MLMKDDKKSMATLIMGKLEKAKDGEASPLTPNMQEVPMNAEGGIDDDSLATETAAQELVEALGSKNPKAIVETLRALMELLKD